MPCHQPVDRNHYHHHHHHTSTSIISYRTLRCSTLPSSLSPKPDGFIFTSSFAPPPSSICIVIAHYPCMVCVRKGALRNRVRWRDVWGGARRRWDLGRGIGPSVGGEDAGGRHSLRRNLATLRRPRAAVLELYRQKFWGFCVTVAAAVYVRQTFWEIVAAAVCRKLRKSVSSARSSSKREISTAIPLTQEAND